MVKAWVVIVFVKMFFLVEVMVQALYDTSMPKHTNAVILNHCVLFGGIM